MVPFISHTSLKQFALVCFDVYTIFQKNNILIEEPNNDVNSRARTAKLSVPIDSAGKNKSEYVLWDMWENFFGEAVRHLSKLLEVKKCDKFTLTKTHECF